MKDPLVVNVILNTNKRELTLACLGSIQQSTYPNQQTIVLDNASTDGSAEAIRILYPQVEIVPLLENNGYAGNNNVGIQKAMEKGADWIFVLNEDILVDPECLAYLIREVESDARIGIGGPMVYHHDEPAVIQSAGGRLGRFWDSIHLGQNEADCGQFQVVQDVDWISGCAILVRRSVVEEIGGLDEGFFYYWEETEWCVRAHRKGWRVIHVPQAKIWHKGVQRNYHPGPDVTYYSTRNRLLMMAKHRAPYFVWISTFLNNSRTLLSWTIRPKYRSMLLHRQAMWQGILDFFAHQTGKRRILKKLNA